MMHETQDITALLFPEEDMTPEQIREIKIWDEATQRAYKLVGDESPIQLMKKTTEIYKGLLAKEGIEYKE